MALLHYLVKDEIPKGRCYFKVLLLYNVDSFSWSRGLELVYKGPNWDELTTKSMEVKFLQKPPYFRNNGGGPTQLAIA